MDLGMIWLGLVMILTPTAASSSGTVGVNYGRLASNLPSPGEAVQLVQSLGINRVRIYDTDAAVLQAFAGTGIELTVSIPHNDIPALAANITTARIWVNTSIVPFYPQTKITAILVGYEVLTSTAARHLSTHLVTAMENVYSALGTLGFGSQIKVSSSNSLRILNISFPPSLGYFDHEAVIRPMLRFLSETGSPLTVNIFTFATFQQDKGRNFPESYSLMDPTGFEVVDPVTRLRYENLFVAQLDSVYSAIDAFGFDDIQVVVAETGWPFRGSTGASIRNARSYIRNLARYCLSGLGTPLVRDRSVEVFIYSLFDEDLEQSGFGLFFQNLTKVFDFDIRTLQSSK